MLLFVVTTIFIFFVYFFLRYFLSSTPNIAGTHILVTGGSSGIGKCIAIEAVRRGANVTILARDKDKLEAAQSEIYHHVVNKERQTVQYFSVDLSRNYVEVEKAIDMAVQRLGPVYMLINCAGNAVSLRFEETPIPEFQRMLDVNYISSVYATKAALPSMKSMGGGHIMFTSSQAGLLGVYGYTAYSASKFALRGLAETLAMELRPYNIKVTMGYPPDTDTPGFENEEKSKPLETKLISSSCGLTSPATVGKKLFADTLQGKFMSSVGFEGFIIGMVCCGMSPITSCLDFILQICCMGPLRLTTMFIHKNFNQIIDKCFQDRMASKKET